MYSSFSKRFSSVNTLKFSLLAACSQRVPAQQPQVAPQLPFWGDVSPYYRCRRQRVLLSAGNSEDAAARPPRRAALLS
jgi:hypothetical protein